MTNEELYANATAAETARIKTIMTSPEARRSPDLAQYFAFETSETAEKAIAVLRAYGSTSTSASFEGRKSAAGSLGLEGSKEARQIWDEAVVKSHRAQGIDDPEIGATGRNLQ